MLEHGDIATILHELEVNRQDSAVLTLRLTDAQFNWKPAPLIWSMAENIAHLCATTRLDLPELGRAIESAKRDQLYSTGPFQYGILSRWFVRSMEPPPKRRFRAPKMYAPPPHAPLGQTRSEFLSQLDRVADLARSANGLDLARVKTQLPAVKFLKMPLGARFLLLTAHNRRHLWQALQVKQHAAFPKS